MTPDKIAWAGWLSFAFVCAASSQYGSATIAEPRTNRKIADVMVKLTGPQATLFGAPVSLRTAFPLITKTTDATMTRNPAMTHRYPRIGPFDNCSNANTSQAPFF